VSKPSENRLPATEPLLAHALAGAVAITAQKNLNGIPSFVIPLAVRVRLNYELGLQDPEHLTCPYFQIKHVRARDTQP
jgi:hypothetical protein